MEREKNIRFLGTNWNKLTHTVKCVPKNNCFI